MHKVNMRQMKAKQSGVIAAITAQGELGRRIRDMGLVPARKLPSRDAHLYMTRWPCV